MTFEQLQKKADSFFEFPTVNKNHVTTTSAVLFALECVKEAIAGRTYCHSDAQVEDDYNKLCDEARWQGAELCAAKIRITELETAIVKTLNENSHLADGDVCTLIDLKRVMPTLKLE